MKKYIFALFLLISVSGFALKNWQNFTNTTHIYDIEKFDNFLAKNDGNIDIEDIAKIKKK